DACRALARFCCWPSGWSNADQIIDTGTETFADESLTKMIKALVAVGGGRDLGVSQYSLPENRLQHKRKESHADAGRGRCPGPPERVTPEQRHRRSTPGYKAPKWP